MAERNSSRVMGEPNSRVLMRGISRRGVEERELRGVEGG
jgi:hypothetical protein